MKIVFWSPVHGQTCQSSNMIALSYMFSEKCKSRVLLTQTQYMMNDLEDALVGRCLRAEIRECYYQDIGLDALIRTFRYKKLNKEDMENCCVQLDTGENWMLLPGSQCENLSVFLHKLQESLTAILCKLEKQFPYIFIDANSGLGSISRQLLREADLVVVNLSQNIGIIDHLFHEFPTELKGKKLFFVFGAYLSDSCYNLTNLRIRYHQLRRNNTAVLPVNVRYMDAISGGQVQDYLVKNQGCEPCSVNASFMRELDKGSEKLWKLCNLCSVSM